MPPASQSKPCRIWPTSEPAPEHGPEGQRERRWQRRQEAASQQEQTGTIRHYPGRRPDLLPLCHQDRPPRTLDTVPARSCACVSEMLPASPKQLRGMYGEGSKLTMCPVLIATGCKCVKQFACNSSWCGTFLCRALWIWSWVHTGGGRHHGSEIVQPPGGRCGRRRHLLEARGERPTGARVVGTRCATAQDVLSGEATTTPRVAVVVSLCVFLNLSVERFGHQVSAPVSLCVSPCVFPLCHRWEAGHQEGEPGQFHVHSDTGRANDAWRLQEGMLPRFRERVCFNLRALGLSGPKLLAPPLSAASLHGNGSHRVRVALGTVRFGVCVKSTLWSTRRIL